MGANKLFYVEFGDPNQNATFSFGGGSMGSMKPIYVVADDYNQASQKAGVYLQNHLETDPEAGSILDGDGSLRNPMNPGQKPPPDPQIISVKLLSDEIIY
jgi:hypothetical protein